MQELLEPWACAYRIEDWIIDRLFGMPDVVDVRRVLECTSRFYSVASTQCGEGT